jgi:glutamyl-tRNA synthetase
MGWFYLILEVLTLLSINPYFAMMKLMEETKKVVTRFAPSPTGFQHIGGIRTALFAYLWARKNNGTFILRIEDTDQARSVEGSIEHLQESLAWVGIDWDYGPDKPGPFGSCIQSERLSTYKEWAEKLVAKGLAYPDPYTAEEVEAFRQKAQEEKRAFLFRDHRPETFGVWDGTTALRFKVSELKRYEWFDEARGTLSAGPEALDDFILLKADGYPTYNLAHIVDDYNMGVTHIFRSDEWISSFPRFLSLYEAFEIVPPVFVTLPPILRSDRTKKLGKRDGAKDVLDYKKEGYLPQAMINYLALIGWNPGTDQEIFSLQEMIDQFTPNRIQKSGAVANEEKLDWINREHIKKLSSEEFWNNAQPFLPSWITEGSYDAHLTKIEQLLRDRIEKFSDIKTLFDEGDFDYFFKEPVIDTAMIVWKALKENPEGLSKTREYLSKSSELLAGVSENEWNYDGIKNALIGYAEQEGKGNVLWPLRVALSGKDKSPDPFELASILGKETVLKRVGAMLK